MVFLPIVNETLAGKIIGLGMAIRAENLKVFQVVVLAITVHMVNLQYERLPVVPRTASAFLTDFGLLLEHMGPRHANWILLPLFDAAASPDLRDEPRGSQLFAGLHRDGFPDLLGRHSQVYIGSLGLGGKPTRTWARAEPSGAEDALMRSGAIFTKHMAIP